jgi:hypothetical protein
MKMKTCLALAIAAGCSSVASANPEKITLNNQVRMSADNIGYIYYDVATGEMIKTSPNQNRAFDNHAIWDNVIFNQCLPLNEWYYFPIRDSATGEDTWWMDWGDIAENSVIDTMTILYATSVADAGEDGEDGFEMDITFFDGIDIGQINSTLYPYLVYTVTDIPGSASPDLTGWIITINLAGGGEFEVGDADGIDDSGNGFNSGYGAIGDDIDIDGDGGADFAYGIYFRHPTGELLGNTGAGLVVPPETTFPNSLGDDDVMALFNTQDWTNPEGFYWFGGYDCYGGAGGWTPWASYFLGLYGGGGGDPCQADMNDDGELNFFDVQLFLSLFSASDPDADVNNDGLWNFFDVQIWLGLFSAGC